MVVAAVVVVAVAVAADAQTIEHRVLPQRPPALCYWRAKAGAEPCKAWA